MGGLRRICKAYGGMTVSANGKTIHYVWDHVADEPVPDTEMPMGSERWKASERRKWGVAQRGRSDSVLPAATSKGSVEPAEDEK